MTHFADDMLADIFGIPKDKSNLQNDDDAAEAASEESDEGAYAEVSDNASTLSYDEKASTLRDKLASGKSEAVEAVEFVDQPPAEAKAETKAPPKPESPVAQQEPTNVQTASNEFERIIREAVSANSAETSPGQQVESEPPVRMDAPKPEARSDDSGEVQANPADDGNNRELGGQVTEPSVPISAVPMSPVPKLDHPKIPSKITKFEWLLESPGSMYDELYESKSGCMPIFLSGGEIDFDVANDELCSAHVNISDVVIEDRELIAAKLKDVQKWRERIVEIKRHVSTQYFSLKAGLRLLRGKLSRIHYEKPADPKQEGVNFDHLRDFELYFARLEALLENCKDVMNTLHNCFETLSRLATLSGINSQSRILGSFDQQMSQNVPPQMARTHIASEIQDIGRDLSGFDSINDANSGVKGSTNTPEPSIKKQQNSTWSDIK